jgi:hypothetical protein
MTDVEQSSSESRISLSEMIEDLARNYKKPPDRVKGRRWFSRSRRSSWKLR